MWISTPVLIHIPSHIAIKTILSFRHHHFDWLAADLTIHNLPLADIVHYVYFNIIDGHAVRTFKTFCVAQAHYKKTLRKNSYLVVDEKAKRSFAIR